MKKRLFETVLLLAALWALAGCKYLRYVPEDRLLLRRTRVVSDTKLDDTDLNDYVQQTPNNYFLGLGRMKLAFYSASDTASQSAGNRWLRRIGEPPVIYEPEKQAYTEEELRKEMFNNGYLNAEVSSELKVKNRQATVTYHVKGHEAHHIRHYMVTIPDSAAAELLNSRRELKLRPREGDVFNIETLNSERERIAKLMRNMGYYNFRKELLFYAVDSAVGGRQVDVELSLSHQYLDNDSALAVIFARPTVRRIVVCGFREESLMSIGGSLRMDTVSRAGYTYVYEHGHRCFRFNSILNKIFFRPGSEYREYTVNRTYEQLNSMPAVKYVNISFTPVSRDTLDCRIDIIPSKPHSLSVEAEVTYSDGDIGVQAGLAYANNNIFRGSETLRVSANGGWDGLGALNDLQNAYKVNGAVSLSFPELLVPTSDEHRYRKVGSTEIELSAGFQNRPEYNRLLFNAAYKYHWRVRRVQMNFNLLDLSYIHLPKVSDAFRDKYLNPYSSIRFSYEDNFIMRLAYNVAYSSRRTQQSDETYFTLRGGVKTAGNLLYGISSAVGQKRNADGQYELFNIAYSQFVKFDFDYAHNIRLHDYVRLACHVGLGVAVPYGNSTIMPYEERYYAGGANSMRGWAARTLGPGNFHNTSGAIDFMRQSGDIKLDLNVEARIKVVWKLEAAVFVDAGNIWTIRDYKEQPGGVFRFQTFLGQLGVDWGVGLRLNFDYFVVRLDMGMKIYDPGREPAERLRTRLTWRDDFALHFAVGYPF